MNRFYSYAAAVLFSHALLMPALAAEAIKPSKTLPTAGMSMAKVEAQFGAPLERSNPVGKPPIRRWDYTDFSVYFEYNHVVHSVQRVAIAPPVTVILEK